MAARSKRRTPGLLVTLVVAPVIVIVLGAWLTKVLDFKLPMGRLKPGVNFEHMDLDADKWLSTATPEACADLCFQRGECRAMSFVVSNGSCWLKYDVPEASPNPDVISATRIRLWPW